MRRLGNRAGSRACRAAPRVCEGEIGDWTTRRVCAEVGEEGEGAGVGWGEGEGDGR